MAIDDDKKSKKGSTTITLGTESETVTTTAPKLEAADYEKAKAQAEQVLQDNFIVSAPINIRDIVSNYGLQVEERDFGNELNQVAGFIDPKSRTIYLNKNDSDKRKNFTIAHELGHWILHRDKLEMEPEKYAILYRIPLGQLSKDLVESEANCFAANLLVPKIYLEEFTKKGVTDQYQLADAFNVSAEVIGFRSKDVSRYSQSK